MNLLTAFKCADDKIFREEFTHLEHKWMIGEETFTSVTLLNRADVIFNVRTQNHSWGQRSQEEEKIIAMQAEFKDINLKFAETKQKYKKLKHNFKKSSSNGSSQRRKRPIREDEKWKFENPENLETMEKDGKTYHWCIHHNDEKGMWTIHHPDKCKNKSKKNSDEQVMAAAYDSDSSESSG